jgi:hypothetical protein
MEYIYCNENMREDKNSTIGMHIRTDVRIQQQNKNINELEFIYNMLYTISPFVVNKFTESSGEKYLRNKE